MEIFTKHSLWLLIPIMLIAAGLAFFFYHKDKKLDKINKLILYSLVFIRFFVLSFLGFLLLIPIIKHYSIFFDKPIIILAQDQSESIGLTSSIDSCKPEIYKKNVLELYKDLSEKYDVKFYTYGDNINDSLDYSFDGKETNFTELFDLIEQKYANYNIGALIIASDGIYNKGSNPVYAAKDFTFPIYTIALGDTANKRDLVIKNVNSNKIAFLNDIFPVELIFSSYGYKGKSVNIRIIKKGKTIASKKVDINDNDFTKQVNFEIEAAEKSLQSYTVVIDREDGEFSYKNNSKQFVVDVIDDKKKILILYNSVHPDIGAIKNALKTNKNLECTSLDFDKFNANKLSEYQMIILHQLPSERHDVRQLVNTINQKKISVLYMLGKQSNINIFNSLKTGVNITVNQQLSELALPEINETFQLFETDDDFVNLLPECAPLTSFFGDYKLDKEFETLLTQNIKSVRTNKPLLAFSNSLYSQSGKKGILFGEGIWKWRIKDYLLNENHIQFDAFINKIIQFLALDVKKERFMIFSKNIVNENEEIIIRAELYNQAYELYNKSDVFFELTNENNKQYKYSFSTSGQSYILNIGRLPAGQYSYRAHTEFDGKKYQKLGKINVISVNLEELNFCANHMLLKQLSEQSNGEFYYPKQYKKLAEEIKERESIKPISHSIIDMVDLIQVHWLLLIIIVLLSIEWFVRKFFGA